MFRWAESQRQCHEDAIVNIEGIQCWRKSTEDTPVVEGTLSTKILHRKLTENVPTLVMWLLLVP